MTDATEQAGDVEEAVEVATDVAAPSDEEGVSEGVSEKGTNKQSVILNRHDDPFAPREGKNLAWRHVNMMVGKKQKKILSDVWGEVPPLETTAIMGPSGSGKTSLLNVLSGRAQTRKRTTVEADITVDQQKVDPADINVRKYMAFVSQDDSLQVASTPREAIRFSARLRLPRSVTDQQINKLVDKMLSELGLTACADTIVGGELLKGISGGERKRTSVGVELVVKPSVVFLDEPTSGLDSFNALQVCQVLKKVASAGSSVLFTIHQPSSEIFNSIDHLILLNQGRVMYTGRVSELPVFCDQHGHPCPEHYNPGDWVMMVAQTVPVADLEAEGFFPKDERDLVETTEEEESNGNPLRSSSRSSAIARDKRPVGTMKQTELLFIREINNLRRNRAAVGARLFLTLFISLLAGCIFLNVAETDYSVPSNLQSAFGALLMAALANVFSTALPSLIQFPEERPVFLREYSTNHYSVLAYFMSRFMMEAVITAGQVIISTVLTYFMVGFQSRFWYFFTSIYVMAMASTAMGLMVGCAVTDPKLAIEALPLMFMPQILLSGFFVTPELIPVWLRWLRWIFPLTYAVLILTIEEFNGRCEPYIIADPLNGGNPVVVDNCQVLIDNLGGDPDDTWWYWLVLVAIFAFFRALALFILRRRATVFY